MLRKIINWAENSVAIQAALLVGSRGQDHNVDELSDYDISLFTDSPSEFIESDDWLTQFGDVWVVVHEVINWGSLVVSTRLVLFDEGIKVDFAFYPTRVLQQYREQYKVLVNKSGELPPQETCQEPTKEQYRKVVEEFWFEVYHVAKYKKRGDLFRADFRLAGLRVPFLEQMISWSERARTPDQLPGLLDTISLFQQLAHETARKYHFSYPSQLENNILRFMERLIV